ncbi:hypothetical protein SAMN05216330_13510 [Bradyrhizobium sp. Ghvi]|uniref:hypothetical protein n=1 Tax=Bradyrhizobium sp. Ghvi TaxID=1855319 RepID=UPI0008E13C54|nr:hypothetical protein [Bradyrhizobium sp. Ghvi]SFQ37077.1 hypothetical protein SAMN05216330_13510 [Bradyrhizobium sp. Ghvi]
MSPHLQPKAEIMAICQTALSLLLAAASAGPAVGAGNVEVLRLLTLSFACPADAYEPEEQTFGTYERRLDRYHWIGDDKTFRLAIDQKRMTAEVNDGQSTSDSRELIEAKIGDIEVAVRNGTDVTIRCKAGAQSELCIVNLPTQPGETIEEGSGDAERSFHACSTEAADDIRIALEYLMGLRR